MAIYGNMVVPSKAAGGALPTDNSERKVYVPGSTVTARLSDQGGVLAGQAAQQAIAAGAKQANTAFEGLGNLGKGLGALAGMGMALYTRQRRIEHAEAMEAVSRLQTEYIEKQREWSQIKGANALNMEELKSRWWDEAMPRLTQGLSDYGQRYFNLNADRVGAMADTFIQNHQEREIKGYEDQQFKLAMDAEGNQIAADPYNQQAVQASLGRLRALWDRQCLRDGTPDDAREAGWQAMVGKAMGNAIGVRISMGDFEGANRLMMQYGASVSPEDQAKLRQSWSAGKMGLLAAYAGAGKVDAIRRELDGNGAQSLNARLEFGAGATLGEKYTWGKNDCSGHTCQIWQAALGDSPAKTAIFGRDGAHTTAAEIMRNAYNYTHKLYQGAEINPTSVKGGWLLATTGQNHAVREGRWNNIGHIVTTYEKGDGSIWVSEASSTSGQVTRMPLQQWLASQERPLLGVDLSSLQPGQMGVLPGGYKGVPSGGTVNVLPQYKPLLEDAAKKAGVDPVLLQAIAMQESDGGRDLRTSRAGAVGLMQIMPSVAKELGGSRDNMQDNIRMGAQYFAKMLKMSGGDVREALLRYNWGPGNVDAWKKTGKGVNGQDMPAEAREYADRVLGHIKGGSIGAPSQSQSQPAQGAPVVTMSKEARETYDAWKAQNLPEGALFEMAQGMASSSDKVKSQRGKEILAALQSEQQAQAPAPAQSAMPQGGQAMGPGFGFTPSEQQKAMNEFVPQAAANAIVDTARSKGGSMAQIKADAFAQLEALPAGERDKYRPIVERRLADLEQNQLAQDGVLYEQTLKTLAGMSPRDREAFIAQMSASGKASPELVKKVRTWNSGVKAVEKESGEAWASEMRGRMDNHYADAKTHSDALEKEVRVKQMRGEITDETAQKLMEWSRTGGSRKNFTQETLKKLYNEGVPKAEWKDPPEDLVQRLWAQMRNAGDKPVGEDEIREMMRKEMLPTTTPYPGMMPFKKTEEVPYHQAMSEGRKVLGVKMDTEQIPQLKREMEELAHRRPDFKLNPNDPEDVKAYYAGKLGGKW